MFLRAAALLVSFCSVVVACGGEVDPGDSGIESSTTAPVDESTGAEVEASFSSEIDSSGPATGLVIAPGEPAYLDALGVDGVRVEIASLDGEVSRSTSFDSTGTAVATGSEGSNERWLVDGEIYEISEGQSIPAMYGLGLIDTDRTLKSDLDPALVDLLGEGTEIVDSNGNPRVEYRVDPAAMLAYESGRSPELWEFRAAEFTLVTTLKGALVFFEHHVRFLNVPPPNQIDPPPPREVDRTLITPA